MLAEWAARYVGIPWLDGGRDAAGCDCWGLMRLVYRDVFAIDLPSHREGYESAADAREVAALLAAKMLPSEWRPVKGSKMPGDGLLFRLLGEPCHVGVYVADGRFLHVRPRADACIERLDGPAWARRFLGAYRHEAAA